MELSSINTNHSGELLPVRVGPNLAIEGPVFVVSNGFQNYTRDGSFTRDATGVW